MGLFTISILQVSITAWLCWTQSLPTQHQSCESSTEHHEAVSCMSTGVIQQLGVWHREADEICKARHSGVHTGSVLLSASQSKTHNACLDPCAVPDETDERSTRVPLRKRKQLQFNTDNMMYTLSGVEHAASVTVQLSFKSNSNTILESNSMQCVFNYLMKILNPKPANKIHSHFLLKSLFRVIQRSVHAKKNTQT